MYNNKVIGNLTINYTPEDYRNKLFLILSNVFMNQNQVKINDWTMNIVINNKEIIRVVLTSIILNSLGQNVVFGTDVLFESSVGRKNSEPILVSGLVVIPRPFSYIDIDYKKTIKQLNK